MTAQDPGVGSPIDVHLDRTGNWWVTCTRCRADLGPVDAPRVLSLVEDALAHRCQQPQLN